MRPTTRSVLALTGGVALLGFVWLLLPGGGPALYDSVCAANPYAYLSPPAGAAKLAPSSASHTVPVSSGTVEGTELNTNELPPQAELTTDTGSIVAPPGATSVTFSIRPLPAPGILPGNGRRDGNFYLFTAIGSNGVAATTNPARPVTVQLRPTVAGAVETIDRLDGNHWTALQTSVGAGCALSMVADTGTLGTFVLVATGASPTPTPPGGPVPLWLGVTAAVLGVIGVALVVLALRPRPVPLSVRPRHPRSPR
jgi:hypothetical protein